MVRQARHWHIERTKCSRLTASRSPPFAHSFSRCECYVAAFARVQHRSMSLCLARQPMAMHVTTGWPRVAIWKFANASEIKKVICHAGRLLSRRCCYLPRCSFAKNATLGELYCSIRVYCMPLTRLSATSASKWKLLMLLLQHVSAVSSLARPSLSPSSSPASSFSQPLGSHVLDVSIYHVRPVASVNASVCVLCRVDNYSSTRQ